MQRIRGVGVRRDVEGVLAVHERQSPDLRDATNVARSHLLAVDNVDAQEYQPARLRKELEAVTATTVPA